MGWDMNLEDRYHEFVRLIRLATTALYVSADCTGWTENEQRRR